MMTTIDAAESIATMRRQFDASPYTCRSPGCASKMLRPGALCSECENRIDLAKALDAKWRDRCPPRYKAARFDSPSTLAARVSDVRAIELARTAMDAHLVVTLLGPPGVGKSTLACALAAQWAEAANWRRADYVTAFHLATARADHPLGHGEAPIIRHARTASLLVIDDIGQEPLSPMSAVVETIHHRHEHERRVIVTSAISRQALGERYGGGLARRLLENATVIDVRTKGTAQ
jgi:DNA replication protein DnaC